MPAAAIDAYTTMHGRSDVEITGDDLERDLGDLIGDLGEKERRV